MSEVADKSIVRYITEINELCGIHPPTIDYYSSNLHKEWKNFEQHVKVKFARPLKEREEEEQVSYL